jgi:Flp pilus assembly protein TadD
VRIENATISYVRYLGKTFWPFDLATPYSDAQLWPIPLFGLAAVGMLALTALLLRSTKQPFLAMGWLWFCGMLVPTIGLVQSGAQSMADRFTYLPSIGLFISLVWFAADCCDRWSIPAIARAALALALLAACWTRTTDQLQYWQNSEKLLTHTLATTKNNWIAEYNLGWELDQNGRSEEALPHYQRALAVKPFDADTLNNVGCYLVRKKQYAEATPYFESALKAKPGRNQLHYNLAHCLFQQNKLEAAIPQYQAFLGKEPNHVEVQNELGVALALSGKSEPATAIFRQILALKPDDAQAHFNLGEALALQGKSAEARAQLSEALRLKPDWAEAQNELRALQSETPH